MSPPSPFHNAAPKHRPRAWGHHNGQKPATFNNKKTPPIHTITTKFLFHLGPSSTSPPYPLLLKCRDLRMVDSLLMGFPGVGVAPTWPQAMLLSNHHHPPPKRNLAFDKNSKFEFASLLPRMGVTSLLADLFFVSSISRLFNLPLYSDPPLLEPHQL